MLCVLGGRGFDRVPTWHSCPECSVLMNAVVWQCCYVMWPLRSLSIAQNCSFAFKETVVTQAHGLSRQGLVSVGFGTQFHGASCLACACLQVHVHVLGQLTRQPTLMNCRTPAKSQTASIVQ